MSENLYPLDPELFAANLAFWDDYNSSIASRLRGLDNFQGVLIVPKASVVDGKTPVNLQVGAQNYFYDDAWALAQKITEEKAATHATVGIFSLSRILADPSHDEIFKQIFIPKYQAFLHANNASEAKICRRQSAQYVVFGLGLGCLLQRLVYHTDAKMILLLEPSIEMLYHSLYVINYPDIFDRMAQRKGSIRLQIEESNEDNIAKISDHLRYNKFTFTQSGLLILNDENVISKDLLTKLSKRFFLVMTTKGFFFDQQIMIRNFVCNTYRRKVPLLCTTEVYKPQLPCFVIGNGPSLEQAIDTLREYKDRAVVISCGTALGSLLTRGIRPDVHVELENIPEVPIILRDLADKYGFEGIHFVHTSTLDPAAEGLFQHNTQFHRMGIDGFFPAAQNFAQMLLSEPTVTNTGLAVAMRFGFSDVYLFGVDMGTVDKSKFHASQNLYDDEKMLDKLGWNKDTGNRKLLPLRFAANFGGAGQSVDFLMQARSQLEQSIGFYTRQFDTKIFNCSDGLYIRGAIPKLPQMVHIDVAPHAKQEFMQVLERAHLRVHDFAGSAEYVDAQLNPQKIQQSFAYFHQLIEDNLTPVDKDTVHPLFDLFTAFEELFERPEVLPETLSLRLQGMAISGTFYLWSQKYIAYDAYLPEDLRAVAAEIFVAALHEGLDEAERKVLEISAEFADVRQEFAESD